ncbi:MAG: low molecular weight protein-tyrosine-phosphatase [Phycisphaerales bacterium]|nr:low molecular weight protein-tyrosine-phosphatase [Phycisphaerales bacterium]
MKILVVCLGNICRSPLAKGLLLSKIKERKLDWVVDSAGTGSYHVGQPPHPKSQAVALEHGIDLSNDRAVQLDQWMLDQYDCIIAMDSYNYHDIIRLCQTDQQRNKVYRFLDFVAGAEDKNVPDPYGLGVQHFKNVFKIIDEGCTCLINFYQNQQKI